MIHLSFKVRDLRMKLRWVRDGALLLQRECHELRAFTQVLAQDFENQMLLAETSVRSLPSLSKFDISFLQQVSSIYDSLNLSDECLNVIDARIVNIHEKIETISKNSQLALHSKVRNAAAAAAAAPSPPTPLPPPPPLVMVYRTLSCKSSGSFSWRVKQQHYKSSEFQLVPFLATSLPSSSFSRGPVLVHRSTTESRKTGKQNLPREQDPEDEQSGAFNGNLSGP
eukprot:762143-Hanusia_phi.AAC.1